MNKQVYDLAIIGGGINGCGIARDAAGRGLKVLLVEQNDLASATSSWSSKLIHGGLRYLEQYEFRLVREALQEREVLLKIAPHLIKPLEFILPHDAHMRPAWMIRLGLWMYDHIGGTISLPRSRGVTFPDKIYSAGLKPSIKRGFFYSDAKVDDARLTLLNALSARALGADIRTRTKLVAGMRAGMRASDANDVADNEISNNADNATWRLILQDSDSGEKSTVEARGVVNAAGPWVKHLLDDTFDITIDAKVKLVKGSHIVVPRIHPESHAYILQNVDKRVVFIIPYQDKFSLIGTTDVDVDSIDDAAHISDAETQYLLAAANRFTAKTIRESEIVWSYAGVRPLYDDGAATASEITRDYVLKTDHVDGKLPLLSIFGGKITTYRRLAEHALDDLKPFYPAMRAPWKSVPALPGGDVTAIDSLLREIAQSQPTLPIDYLRQLVNRHGTRTAMLLANVASMRDLGECFGVGAYMLSEREIDFCITQEFARRPEDILWRRTKCGLHMDAAERARAAEFIEGQVVALGTIQHKKP